MWRILTSTFFFAVLAALVLPSQAGAGVRHYDLTATRGSVNLSGERTVDFALQLNGSIPAPVLEFTEGDDAEVVIRNGIPGEELSIHWHGILLPNAEDGVPYVTTPPIPSGGTYTARFKIRQHGTYWYHSHTNVQEQRGLYGAIVIHPRKPAIQVDRDVVAVLSDWSDEEGMQILRNLRKDGDYYLYKKGTLRSWLGALRAGRLGSTLGNEWNRMSGMDLSDVGYDAFLINGRRESSRGDLKPGERVRLRIINASASTYFQVALGREPLTVVSADGTDIAPVRARSLLLGMAETEDVVLTVGEGKSLELRATAQDGTGHASLWLGSGEPVSAPEVPQPDLYAPMDHVAGGEHVGHGDRVDHGDNPASVASVGHSGHEEHSAHGAHHASQQLPVELLTVDGLRASDSTVIARHGPVHEFELRLGGDMSRYVWHINGKAIHEDRNIVVGEGDLIRIRFVNETMMHHPMHLHGHFFRVLNAAGDLSPLKHTVDVPPHGSRTIEFLANEPGEWLLHCHHLFHMKSGMARVVHYAGVEPSPEIAALRRHDPHLHDHWYGYGRIEAATNHAQAFLRFSQTWNQLEARIEGRNRTERRFSFSEPWEAEGDFFYRRWMGSFLSVAGGITLFDEKVSAAIGVAYRLPLLVESQFLLDHRGRGRLNFEKKFHWTSSVYTDVDFAWRSGPIEHRESPAEFELATFYSPSWSWAVGLMLTERSLGAGLQLQF